MIGDQDACPVLVVGCPRSGTSALSWALDSHSQFWAGPESDFIWHLYGGGRLVEAYAKSTDRPDEPWLICHKMGFEEFCRCIGAGIDAVFAARTSKPRWVDSTPAHTLMAQELASLLPGGRFLHLVRDGRLVVDSMLKSGFSEDWASDFDCACKTWATYVERGLELERRYPGRVLRVNHAELVRTPHAQCKRILDFLEVAWEPGPGDFLASSRVNSSFDNVGENDIRAVKSTGALMRVPGADWGMEKTQRFQDLCGAAVEAITA